MPRNFLSVQQKISRLFGYDWNDKREPNKIQQLEQKVEMLTELVIELLREVEALRSTEIERCKSARILPKDSIYRKQYRETALLTHNSAGPSGGLDKLLSLWLIEPPTATATSRFTEYVTEFVILQRLGYSDADLQEYLREVDMVSTFT